MALHNSNGTADGSRSHGEGPMNGHGDGKDGQQQQLSSDSSLLHRRSGSSSSSSMANHGAPNNGNALRRNSATSEDGDDSIDDDSSAFTPLYDGSSIDKREFVRLTIQSLKELGFESAAKALAMESGFKMEHPSILAFRQAVLSGDWRSAERLLFDGLNSAASRIAARSAIAGTSSSAGLDLVLRDPRHLGIEHIKFLIDQQRYLELLEARQTKKALSILRDRLAPHNAGTDRLHHLSSLVICASPEELRARAKWPGAGVTSRTELLHAIESAVLPSIMVPSRRLPELLEQAQLEQKRSDPYFNLPLDTHVSLYTDKVSDRSSFPTDTAAILTGHTDEVLHVAFSNSGTKLATAGKDKMVIVWSVGGRQSDFEVLHRLGPHLAAVWSVAWSPDDKSLLSTTVDGDVAVWNIEDGSRKEYAKHHYEAAGAWLPDGRHFLTASMDASVVIWDNAEEKKLHTWKTSPFRVLAFDVSPNGRYLAAVSHRAIPSRPSGDGRTPGTAGTSSTRSYSYSESPSPLSMMTGNADDRPTTSHAYRDVNEDQFSANGGPEGRARGEDGRSDTGGGNRVLTDEKYRLSFYDVEAREELGSIYFYEEMSSVCFSHDSQQILVNRKPNEAQLWDFQRQSLLRRYTGHQIARNVIRSCFGGATRNFVLSGSEDAKIYVYHRRSGQLLDRLAGHGEGCVNSVAWHPWDFALFASASDDTTVRIWRPKRLLGTALGVEEEAAGRLRRQMDELERSGNSPSIGNGVGHTVRRRSAVNGEGRATGQGATNGSTSRSSDARDGSVDLDMMGPTPFPWSVSPQHPSTSTMGRDTDENGDISMAAGSSREQQHPQARGYSSPLSTPGRRRRIRGGSGGTGTRRFMETVGGMEVEVDEDEEDEGEGDEDEDEEDGEEEDDEEGVEGEEDDEDDEDEEGEGEEVMEEAD